eukprot:CAMPEP_0168734128 /NCGR_PEP_ID=MMETSP0724-20121128/8650_1 /TAXON_ID=265536 /ORGANISM="Amphiprora sp., Strain CCMP467" /LENGTH=689 /DNA_ID=CAMNT_0008781215 /DNA_START=204 /DNA_END=2273 /DNA_ORIENTATION=-
MNLSGAPTTSRHNDRLATAHSAMGGETRDLVDDKDPIDSQRQRHQKPAQNGKSQQRKVIRSNRSSHGLTRKVSGLGMEDPVSSVYSSDDNGDERHRHGSDDMRGTISVASDPTADATNSGVDVAWFHHSLSNLDGPVSRNSHKELSAREGGGGATQSTPQASNRHPSNSGADNIGASSSAGPLKRTSLDSIPKRAVRKSSATCVQDVFGADTIVREKMSDQPLNLDPRKLYNATSHQESIDLLLQKLPPEHNYSGDSPPRQPRHEGKTFKQKSHSSIHKQNQGRTGSSCRPRHFSLSSAKDPLERPRNLRRSHASIFNPLSKGPGNSHDSFSSMIASLVMDKAPRQETKHLLPRNAKHETESSNFLELTMSMPEFVLEDLPNDEASVNTAQDDCTIATQTSTSALKRNNPRWAAALSEWTASSSHQLDPNTPPAIIPDPWRTDTVVLSPRSSVARDKAIRPPARVNSQENLDRSGRPPKRVVRKGTRRPKNDVSATPPRRARSNDDSFDLMHRKMVQARGRDGSRATTDAPPVLPPMTCMMEVQGDIDPNGVITINVPKTNPSTTSSALNRVGAKNSIYRETSNRSVFRSGLSSELPSSTHRSLESQTSLLGTSHTVNTRSSESTIHLPGINTTSHHSEVSFGDSTWFTETGSSRLDSMTSNEYAALFDWELEGVPPGGALRRIASAGE